MPSPLVTSGYRFSRRTNIARSASSLIELLVVIFIMGIMLSMLLPALTGARNHAQVTVCQNNIRQLKYGLMNFISSRKRFPDPNHWTIDILKWIEEVPLADQMSRGIDPKAKYPRPPLFCCPMQPDFDSRVLGVAICQYVLAVDRPIATGKIQDVPWQISDRAVLDNSTSYDPWYAGPELSLQDQQSMFASEKGPHPSGLFQTENATYPQP
jgi:hypothetical protein